MLFAKIKGVPTECTSTYQLLYQAAIRLRLNDPSLKGAHAIMDLLMILQIIAVVLAAIDIVLRVLALLKDRKKRSN